MFPWSIHRRRGGDQLAEDWTQPLHLIVLADSFTISRLNADDYLLLKQADFEKAKTVLQKAGHTIHSPDCRAG